MEFKFSTTLKIGEGSLQFNNLKADTVILTDLYGTEAKCSQCMLPLKEGDSVIVLHDTIVNDHEIPLDENTYIVHIKNGIGGTCLEDFISRLQNSHVLPLEETPKEVTPPAAETPAENIVVEELPK